MEKYLDANDILTLLFIGIGFDKEITQDDVIDFISYLFKTRKSYMREDKVEVEIPQLDNFDTEMFCLSEDKYRVVNSNSKEQQLKLIKMCNNILDKEYTDFNKDIEKTNKSFIKQYIAKQNNPKTKIR